MGNEEVIRFFKDGCYGKNVIMQAEYNHNDNVLINFVQLLYNCTFNSISFNHFNMINGLSQLTI